MALQGLGVDAVSYTGAQAGIFTTTSRTPRPRSRPSTRSPVENDLEAGRVVIVAGFQGINDDGQITTLGRGGSDPHHRHRAALYRARRPTRCEIYTDVDGVYTADPRVVKNAQKLMEISYDEMLGLASSGSKVMQSRSVEFAKKYNVIFEVRSSALNHNPGTTVKEKKSPTWNRSSSAASPWTRTRPKIVVSNIPDKPGSAAKGFTRMADANIIVDMRDRAERWPRHGIANLTFTVPQGRHHRKAAKALESCVCCHQAAARSPLRCMRRSPSSPWSAWE